LYLKERKWWEAGEDCIMRSFITCVRFAKYYWGDEVMEGEMGGEYSTHGRNMYKIMVRKI
jgi:hypothetical protein